MSTLDDPEMVKLLLGEKLVRPTYTQMVEVTMAVNGEGLRRIKLGEENVNPVSPELIEGLEKTQEKYVTLLAALDDLNDFLRENGAMIAEQMAYSMLGRTTEEADEDLEHLIDESFSHRTSPERGPWGSFPKR